MQVQKEVTEAFRRVYAAQKRKDETIKRSKEQELILERLDRRLKLVQLNRQGLLPSNLPSKPYDTLPFRHPIDVGDIQNDSS